MTRLIRQQATPVQQRIFLRKDPLLFFRRLDVMRKSHVAMFYPATGKKMAVAG